MGTLLKTLLFLFFVAMGVAIGVGNPQEVVVNFFVGKFPSSPDLKITLGMLLSGTLLVGACIGFLVSVTVVWGLKIENLRLKRRMQSAVDEVKNLRKLPIQD